MAEQRGRGPRTSAGVALAAALALSLAAAVVAWIDAAQHGVTWDAGVQARYGDLVRAYFESGGSDRRASRFLDLRYYGPAFELLASWWTPAEGPERFQARSRLTALAGLLTLPSLVRLAWLAGRPWLAPASIAALLTLPRFWGHLPGNSKDVPLAAAVAWALSAAAALALAEGRPWRRVLELGAAVGLAAALRPGVLPLLALFGALALAAGSLRTGPQAPGAAQPAPRPGASAALADGAAKGAVALGLAWLAMVALWPWAHEAPFLHPLEAMGRAARFASRYPVLFAGQIYPSDALPRHYLATWLAITTPPATGALAAVGVAAALRRVFRAPRAAEARLWIGVLLWIGLPVALFAGLRPAAYDGLRHALFVLPALALLAGLGVVRLVDAMGRGPGRVVGTLALSGALASPLPALVRLHPYEATYFNGLVGGLAGADGRYETDYWASSYREAMAWIEGRARQDGPLRVLVAANAWSLPCAAVYASERVELVPVFPARQGGALPEEFDYFLATSRYGQHRSFPDTPVRHRIGRDGATFAVVRGRGPAPAAGPSR